MRNTTNKALQLLFNWIVIFNDINLKAIQWNLILEEITHFLVSVSIAALPLLYICFFFLNYYFKLFVAIYTIYMLLDPSPKRGGRSNYYCKTSAYWKYYATYFNSKLIKTCDLNPDKKYIFGYHPHGLIGLGALCNFASNGTNFMDLFPNLSLKVATLPINFYLPFYRDFFLLMGLIDCDKKSLNFVLNELKQSVLIVVGGAKEAMISNPGKADLILNDRYGFIKLAIVNGADLVPVYNFGENHLYYIYELNQNKILKWIQTYLKTTYGFYLPLIQGRTPFTENWGFMPRRVQCTTIVGKPIKVKQEDEPSVETIKYYHELYTNGLKEIYEEYKEQYPPEKDMPVPELKLY
ncbi:diacylglycerol acyltransferase [Neoconidiobolus thromboides FSU 785]|nr:diacylglycerol acyltransferase [Neoconidiobolus thromboides FSU 785]